jgi:hypothetical protein
VRYSILSEATFVYCEKIDKKELHCNARSGRPKEAVTDETSKKSTK